MSYEGSQGSLSEEESLELSLGFRVPEKEQARLWEQQGQKPSGRKEPGNLEPEVGACRRGQVVREVGRRDSEGALQAGEAVRMGGTHCN